MKKRSLAERGFTLVELLMATTAGLIVSAAAFLLAKNAATITLAFIRLPSSRYNAGKTMTRNNNDVNQPL